MNSKNGVFIQVKISQICSKTEKVSKIALKILLI